MNKLLARGKKIFLAEQTSILSAAFVIMAMIVASQILGYIRTRVIIHFFAPHESTLFFAAFRLPDLIFEVLIFGTFSSAFIPVFTKLIKRGNGEAWDTAGRVVNIGLLIFVPLGIFVAVFAESLYKAIAPGFSSSEVSSIASLARVLLIAQGIFIVSYILTGVLESLRRFLIPALAPIFYNIGIIVGTVLFSSRLGLMGPAIGVVLGALAHLLIQLPLAYRLGFRFVFSFSPNESVKKIGRLSLPRFVEILFQQFSKIVELNLASLISTAAYTYLYIANTLQLIPVRLFGTTIAKAALPTLARQEGNLASFRRTLIGAVNQALFLVLPLTAILIVLRIPVVRLAFGTDLFGWEATIETSLVLTAFALSIPFQATLALLNRAFYALHDTKTPVAVSIISSVVGIVLSFIFVKRYGLPAWGLALAFSVGSALQTFVLLYLIGIKTKDNLIIIKTLLTTGKSLTAALVSGSIMYFLLKFFDRSVWVKRLSFLSSVDSSQVAFDRFVLDTRYTVNLFILTFLVATIGLVVYLLLAFLMKSKELGAMIGLIKWRKILPSPPKDGEPISPAS